MKLKFVAVIPAFVAAGAVAGAQKSNATAESQKTGARVLTPQPALQYPIPRKSGQVDNYHGTVVADPYRWLEDTDSPETRAWIKAENAVTFSYLNSIPQRTAIRDKLQQLWNYPRYSSAFKAGDRYFYYFNPGLQNQSALWVQDGKNGRARILLDPNTLSPDGTVALSTVNPSENGRYIAYSISRAGSDWQEFHVRDVQTGKDLPDHLDWAKFSDAAWTHDNKGFFYERFDEQKGNTLTNVVRSQKIYYHHLNTPQSQDELIYDRTDKPDWLYGVRVSDDGMYAVITVEQGTDVRTQLFFIDLDNPGKPRITAPVVRLIEGFDAAYEFVGNSGTMFFVKTDRQAPRGRIVAIDIDSPRPERWVTTVAEANDALKEVRVAGGRLVAAYLQDAKSSLRVYNLPLSRAPGRNSRPGTTERGPTSGQMAKELGGTRPLYEIQLPGIGTISDIDAHADDDEFLYTFESFLQPATIYTANVSRRNTEPFKQTKLAADVSGFETRQVFYQSKDGTRIPMFVIARKGLVQNGENPTLLYGYGGFDISKTPEFDPAVLVWLQMGGVYAVANIRGGGEYGKPWHEAGMLDKKQNVFDDFIGAAEYLIREKYTSTPKLAVWGRSNGGLLIGAVLNQRPDLFGAALPVVGVMDMLRFQKFTIGWAWTSDYGSSDDPKQFRTLYAYSPLHNIKPGTCYPPTMILTADHDDRVVPGHSFKYAATLQAAQSCANPTLIRIESDAGHAGGSAGSSGKPIAKLIDEFADRYAFLVKNLGMTLNFD